MQNEVNMKILILFYLLLTINNLDFQAKDKFSYKKLTMKYLLLLAYLTAINAKITDNILEEESNFWARELQTSIGK